MTRKIRVLQRSLQALTFICASTMTFVEASAEEGRNSLLNKDEVRLLEDAAFQLDVSVPDLLGLSFHSWGGCDYKLATCTTPVMKRNDAYVVEILGAADFPDNQMGREVLGELIDELRQVMRLTNLELSFSRFPGVNGIFSIVFVDSGRYRSDPALFFEDALGKRRDKYPENIEGLFVDFLNSPARCEAHVIALDSGEIQESFAWIKSDIDRTLIRGCLVTTFAGALGVEVGRLAQSAEGRQVDMKYKSANFAVGKSIHALLRVLYSDGTRLGADFRENRDFYSSLTFEVD
jgi:hypothetical protein